MDYLRTWSNGLFLGMKSVQWQSDYWLWEKFFLDNPIKKFIELGYGYGATSLFFILQGYQHGFDYIGFDSKKAYVLENPIAEYISLHDKFIGGDIFEDKKAIIIDYIEKSNEPLLLYCDNGDKPKEVSTFSPYLLPGDYVVVHDWGTEIKQKDIPSYLEECFTELPDEVGSLTRWFIKK